jgi:Domain of unknown function (DUF4157)
VSYAAFARREPETSALRPKAAMSSFSGGLRIGEPNDAFEREADRVAAEVMAGGALKRHWSLPSLGGGTSVQRKCSCGGAGGSGGECEQCKQENEGKMLQRKAAGATQSGVAPPVVQEVLNSPGRPLDRATRDFFEPRFGHDLSRVRIHTDALAAQSARSVNAAAYSVGGDMVFAERMFAPSSTEGRRLIAHELTHVLQQGTGHWRTGLSDRQHQHQVAESRPDQRAGAAGLPRQAVISQQLGYIGLQRQPQGQGGGGLDPGDQKIVDAAQRETAKFKCNVGPVIWGIINKHFSDDGRKVAGTACEAALPGLRTEFSTTDPKDPKLKRSVPMILAGKAFLAATDAAHLQDRVADVAKEIEKIDAWRLSNFLIDAKDLANPKITGQLRSMSNTQLMDYKNKTKDSEVKRFTENLLTFSTPTQPGASVDPLSGDMTMKIGNVNVVIKPDVHGAAAKTAATAANVDVSPPGIPGYKFDKDGVVSEFPGYSPAVTLEIVTTYPAGMTPQTTQGYGRGTTTQDVSNKATSVRFHEGAHGEDYINFIRQKPFPVFAGKVGMKKADFEKAKKTYTDAVSDWGKALKKVTLQGECVGKTIDEFHKGEKGYKNICP